MRKFDIAERRDRLSRRHRLAPGHRAASVGEAADAIVCLHGTDPASVYLSAWARVDGLTLADLDQALYSDRALVKHLAMRRTLFVFRRELLGVVQAAASHRVADQERRRLARDLEKAALADDGAAWVEAASEATVTALGELGEPTTAQLRQALGLPARGWR